MTTTQAAFIPLQLSAGASTHPGLRRPTNEDSVLAEYPVFLVADGMGGHDAGDKASAAVVEAFRPLVGRDDVDPDEVVVAIENAHQLVAGIAKGTKRGAGSTATGVVAVRQGTTRCWLAFNIGDSRVYRLLAHRLEQVTVDHSVAQELVDQGKLAREDMAEYKGRNVITRAVGDSASAADYWLLPIVTGERILACSDGLTGELPDEAIRAGLTLGGSTPQTAQSLVAQAVSRGGRDNVSVVVVDVVAGGISPSSDEVTGGLSFDPEASATIEVDTVASARKQPRGD